MLNLFLTMLQLMLIAFKLVGVIAWPWIWVFVPAWGPVVLWLALVLAAAALRVTGR